MNIPSQTAVCLSLIACMFLTGCAGLAIPVPSYEGKAISGTILTKDDLKRIIPGTTTREEVESRMGPRFRATHDNSAISYSWERTGGDVYSGWFIAAPTTLGFFADGDAGHQPNAWSYWRAIFIQFDADDRVKKTEFVHLSSRRSLDEQLEAWLAKNRRREISGYSTKPNAHRP